MTDRVLVTGVTGYIGSHCGAELLREGYEVVGSVRSMSKAEGVKAGIAAVAPVEQLSFCSLDLTSDDGWDEAMEGCRFVLHVASPFTLTEPKDEDELIRPAVDGTRRAIGAAQRAGVERMVLTSSVAAISAASSGEHGPDSWSDVNADIGAYSKSKTLAERAAWEAAESGDMELVTINPGAVIGPSLTGKVDAQSLEMANDMITGKMPAIPDLRLGVIDVRDVARLHVAAMTAAGAAGQRFIASSRDAVPMMRFAELLKEAGYSKVSTRKAPKLLLRVMSLFDDDVKGLLPMIGQSTTYDNRQTFDVLGWEPTPFEDSMREMAASISG